MTAWKSLFEVRIWWKEMITNNVVKSTQDEIYYKQWTKKKKVEAPREAAPTNSNNTCGRSNKCTTAAPDLDCRVQCTGLYQSITLTCAKECFQVPIYLPSLGLSLGFDRPDRSIELFLLGCAPIRQFSDDHLSSWSKVLCWRCRQCGSCSNSLDGRPH